MAKLERENRELRKVNEVVKARRVSSAAARALFPDGNSNTAPRIASPKSPQIIFHRRFNDPVPHSMRFWSVTAPKEAEVTK